MLAPSVSFRTYSNEIAARRALTTPADQPTNRSKITMKMSCAWCTTMKMMPSSCWFYGVLLDRNTRKTLHCYMTLTYLSSFPSLPFPCLFVFVSFVLVSSFFARFRWHLFHQAQRNLRPLGKYKCICFVAYTDRHRDRDKADSFIWTHIKSFCALCNLCGNAFFGVCVSQIEMMAVGVYTLRIASETEKCLNTHVARAYEIENMAFFFCSPNCCCCCWRWWNYSLCVIYFVSVFAKRLPYKHINTCMYIKDPCKCYYYVIAFWAYALHKRQVNKSQNKCATIFATM